MYTTDTVPLGYGSVCHNSTFVRLLLVYQFILNLNLTVNILLRAFKSFLGKYSIVCFFKQTNHFSTHAIFHVIHFAINQFLKFLNLNKLAINFTIYLHQINLKQFNMQIQTFLEIEIRCKTQENSNFRKKGKIVILVKIQNFSKSRMTKRTSPMESSCEI